MMLFETCRSRHGPQRAMPGRSELGTVPGGAATWGQIFSLFTDLGWVARIGALLGMVLLMLCTPAQAEDGVRLKGGVTHQNMMMDAQSNPGVVGLDLEIRPGEYPQVLRILPGTPAAGSGFQVGDSLLAIDAVDPMGLSRDAVDQAISDVPGDPVRFIVFRAGRMFRITLTVAPLSQVHSPSTRALFGD